MEGQINVFIEVNLGGQSGLLEEFQERGKGREGDDRKYYQHLMGKEKRKSM